MKYLYYIATAKPFVTHRYAFGRRRRYLREHTTRVAVGVGGVTQRWLTFCEASTGVERRRAHCTMRASIRLVGVVDGYTVVQCTRRLAASTTHSSASHTL
jgi:hypothetical protein